MSIIVLKILCKKHRLNFFKFWEIRFEPGTDETFLSQHGGESEMCLLTQCPYSIKHKSTHKHWNAVDLYFQKRKSLRVHRIIYIFTFYLCGCLEYDISGNSALLCFICFANLQIVIRALSYSNNREVCKCSFMLCCCFLNDLHGVSKMRNACTDVHPFINCFYSADSIVRLFILALFLALFFISASSDMIFLHYKMLSERCEQFWIPWNFRIWFPLTTSLWMSFLH